MVRRTVGLHSYYKIAFTNKSISSNYNSIGYKSILFSLVFRNSQSARLFVHLSDRVPINISTPPVENDNISGMFLLRDSRGLNSPRVRLNISLLLCLLTLFGSYSCCNSLLYLSCSLRLSCHFSFVLYSLCFSLLFLICFKL